MIANFNALTKPFFSRKVGLEKSQISYCTGTWDLKSEAEHERLASSDI